MTNGVVTPSVSAAPAGSLSERGIWVGHRVFFSRNRQSWLDVEENGYWELVVNGKRVMFGDEDEIDFSNSSINFGSVSQASIFKTPAELLTKTPPANVNRIWVQGLNEPFDGGGAYFARKTVSPTVAPANNPAVVIDFAGQYWINDEPEIDARTRGVKGGARVVTTAGMTAGSTTLGATGANFTDADRGKRVALTGVGTFDNLYNNDSQMNATIVSVSNVNNCVLDTPAVTTASAQYCVIGWDDTLAISETNRAAATLGRWSVIPPGDYVTNGTVSGLAGYSFLRCRGAGMTATRLISIAIPQAGIPAFQFVVTGGLPPGPYMTVPAPAGTNTITLSSVTGISVGNLLLLSALDQPNHLYDVDWPGSPLTIASNNGDVARVRSIDVPSKTILLEGGLLYSYTANATPALQSTVQRMDVGVETSLRDMCLEHVSTSTNAGCSHVSFGRVLRPRIENVVFKHTGGQCIPMDTWVDGISDNVTFNFIGGADALDTEWGYGFSITGSCWHVIISNIVAWRCRHAVTMGGALPNPGPHYVHFSQFFSYGCRINFDTHQGSRFITFEDCHSGPGAVLLNVPTPGSFGVGFQIRARDSKVINCTAAGTQGGFTAAYTTNVRFEGCHAQDVDTAYNCISSPNTEWINCTARNYRVQGFHAYRQSNTLTSMPGLRWKGCSLYGNPTKQELEDDQTKCLEPAAFTLGYWDSSAYPPGNFVSTYEDSWELDDIHIYGAKKRFYGLPETGAVYGALQQNTVIAESISLDEVNGTATLISGTMLMAAIDIEKGAWVSKLDTMFNTVPVGQTNLWFSIWDWNMNLLGVTADALTVAPAANVLTSLDVAVPFEINHTGRHYIGITQVAGTPSTVHSRTIATGLINVVPKRAGTSNVGLTTPASLPNISAATSTSSLPIFNPLPDDICMQFTTQSGKAFTKGMPILIASTASPANLMRARVSQYTTTALFAEIYETEGSGTFAAWDITAKAKATAITGTANWMYVGVS